MDFKSHAAASVATDPLEKANTEARRRLLEQANALACAITARRLSPADGVARIHEAIIVPLGHPEQLQGWCRLYSDCPLGKKQALADKDALSAAIRSEAERFAARCVDTLLEDIESARAALRFIRALETVVDGIAAGYCKTRGWISLLFRGPQGTSQVRPRALRIALRAFSVVLLVAGAGLFFTVLLLSVPLALLNQSTPIITALLPITAWAAHVFWSLGRRVGLSTAVEAMQAAPNRPPVLYLRSFAADSEQEGADRKMALDVREEDVLASVFELVGPFVAVGDPGETLPKYGASRVYLPQDHWQGEVHRLMQVANVVLLKVGDTPGFLWEVETAFATVPPERLLFCFSQSADERELRAVYNTLRTHIKSRSGAPLPRFIEKERFLRFEPGWKPVLFGRLDARKRLRLWLAPFSAAATRRSWRKRLSRGVQPYFAARGWLEPGRKLFSDGAVLCALGAAGPAAAAVMMGHNCWAVGRRYAAFAAFVSALMVAATIVGVLVWGFPELENHLDGVRQRRTQTLLAAVWIAATGYGLLLFACWQSWIALSGRDIRRHLAFGGDVVHALWWLLPVLVAAAAWWALLAETLFPGWLQQLAG